MNVKVETDGYELDTPKIDMITPIHGSRRRVALMVFAPTSAAMRLWAGVGAKAKKSNGVPDAFNISAERMESLPAPFKRSALAGRSNRAGAGSAAEASNGNAMRLWKSICIS